MPAFKLSMIFDYLSGDNFENAARNKAGWSESVYWDDIATGTVRSFNTLARARAALLPRYARVKGLRFQQVDPNLGSSTRAVNYPGAENAANMADIPQVALMVDLTGAGVVNKSRYRIAALPDAQVRGGEYQPDFAFRTLMGAFLGQLAGWKFRGADLTKPLINLKTISAAGVYETQSDLTVAVGNTVRVRGAIDEGGSLINGDFVIDAATTLRTGTLRNWSAGACTGGKIRHLVWIYPTILADPAVNRIVVRKVGRPFAAYVGRQRRRRRVRPIA